MWDLYAVNGHIPHKGLVSGRFDECGAELGEEGKDMVPEGGPCQYGQSSSRTLCSMWRGGTKYCCQVGDTDVPDVYVFHRGN